jgi:hypothetical protein
VSTAEPSAETDDQGRYEFVDVSAGTHRLRQVVQDGFSQTQPAGSGAHAVDLVAGQQVTGIDFGDTTGPPAAQVVGRHVFYNRSRFDGNNASATAADDDAIATDKVALLPGESASFANYTSYSRGINGLMVDVANLPAGVTPTAADFVFQYDNGGPSAPVAAPAPTRVALRRGAGDGGSDRLTLVWNDNVIRNRWLRVTVSPTANTGLTTPDVFFFGHLAGETGDSADGAAVNGFDLLGVRRALVAPSTGSLPIDDAFDFNRDGRVTALDMAVVRAGQRRLLPLMSAPVPAVPAVSRAAALRASRVWEESAAPVLD